MSGPDVGTVTADERDGVVTLTLSNPDQKNALTNRMWFELSDHLARIDAEPEFRAIVIAGAGNNFCAGVALTGSTATHPTQLERMQWMSSIVLQVKKSVIPVVAKVDGVAFGIGMNLAIACDLIVASDRARFCEVFVRRALSVDGGGSWLLPRLVGPAVAKELCLLGDEVDARRAHEIGLVNRVVAPERLDVTAADLASRLATMPRLAVRQSKALLDQAWSHSIDDAVQAESRAQCLNITGHDFQQAMQTFKLRAAGVGDGNSTTKAAAAGGGAQ
jgi:enoyl-CoA hydratase/carnithine racemase